MNIVDELNEYGILVYLDYPMIDGSSAGDVVENYQDFTSFFEENWDYVDGTGNYYAIDGGGQVGPDHWFSSEPNFQMIDLETMKICTMEHPEWSLPWNQEDPLDALDHLKSLCDNWTFEEDWWDVECNI
jgi:hypothetical protein